jgi:proprotein convertase subtilisin/kexin type 5
LDSCPGTGYVTFMSTTCLPCHQTCRTCINQTSSGCVTCADGLYLQNNLCRYVCSPGMYPNTVSMTCLTCDNKCQFCFGSTVDNCTQCQTGYVLDNFTCTTSCPTGQTPNNYSVCDIATTFERLIKISSFMILLIVWIII